MIFIHTENSSSVFTRSKYVRKLSVVSKNWTLEVPQVWSTVTDRVLTWCPYYSYEAQTCIISSHEKLEIKISSWRFYLVLETCDLRQSANASNNSNLNFGHWCKRIFKCLNQFVMTGFFFPFFVPGLILKTKPYQDVRPRAIDFSNSFSTSFFTFVRKVMMIFFNQNCFTYFAYFAPWCNFLSSSLWSTR